MLRWSRDMDVEDRDDDWYRYNSEGGDRDEHVPVLAAPLPPAPLHPRRSQARGVRDMRNPIRQIGVGLPKVLRRLPAGPKVS